MGNGRAKKPPFPGIESRANAHSGLPQAWHSRAIRARARAFL